MKILKRLLILIIPLLSGIFALLNGIIVLPLLFISWIFVGNRYFLFHDKYYEKVMCYLYEKFSYLNE